MESVYNTQLIHLHLFIVSVPLVCILVFSPLGAIFECKLVLLIFRNIPENIPDGALCRFVGEKHKRPVCPHHVLYEYR